MKPERLKRTAVYESPWINLYLDTVRFPNGRVIENYHLLDFPTGAVTAIMENGAGQVAFVQVPRYTTGKSEWELPAGGVDLGESILAAAEREALEETGYASSDHQLIYSYYPMNGSANKVFHVIVCRAGALCGHFDKDEVSAVRWFDQAEIEKMIAERTITDGFSLTALLLWLRER